MPLTLSKSILERKETSTTILLRRAVERELEIIGEATNQLLKIHPSIAISDARRVVDLRNWVIHAYDSVDDIIIWGIITINIPNLKVQVQKLLDS